MSDFRYRYYNRNPDGAEIEDCVTRAISTCTGLKYDAVTNLLELSAKQYQCEKLCVCCYHYLLENILCYPVHFCEMGETVGEIAERYKDSKVIIRIAGHLTCAIMGTVVDIWNCTHKEVDCYWVVA